MTGGGFTLTDKNDTVYKFTQSLGSGAYGITSITDALGRAETFTYNGSGQVTTDHLRVGPDADHHLDAPRPAPATRT